MFYLWFQCSNFSTRGYLYILHVIHEVDIGTQLILHLQIMQNHFIFKNMYLWKKIQNCPTEQYFSVTSFIWYMQTFRVNYTGRGLDTWQNLYSSVQRKWTNCHGTESLLTSVNKAFHTWHTTIKVWRLTFGLKFIYHPKFRLLNGVSPLVRFASILLGFIL